MSQQQAAIDAATLAIAEAIQTLGEIPSGVLYARLMGYMSYMTYERIIDVLVSANVVRRQSHVLIWIGPAMKES